MYFVNEFADGLHRQSRDNFNRNWLDLSGAIADSVGPRLGRDAAVNVDMIRKAAIAALKAMQPVNEIQTMRVEVMKLSRQVDEQTKEKLEDKQREFYLREQMRTIQKELGDAEEGADMDDLRAAIEKAGMPEEALTQARKYGWAGDDEAHWQWVRRLVTLVDHADYYLVLPWHFKDSILRREKEFLAGGGKFIFPFPEIEII